MLISLLRWRNHHHELLETHRHTACRVNTAYQDERINQEDLPASFWMKTGLFFQATKMKYTGMPVAIKPRPIAMKQRMKIEFQLRSLSLRYYLFLLGWRSWGQQ